MVVVKIDVREGIFTVLRILGILIVVFVSFVVVWDLCLFVFVLCRERLGVVLL